MNYKFVPVIVIISFIISGCGFLDKGPNANVESSNVQNSLKDTFTSDDFKLTRVMDSAQVKSSEVLSFSCEIITARPTEVTTYCADFGTTITNIEWKSWTASGAIGTANYLVNNCNPDCASGKVSESPVGVNLDGLYTDGERYFLRYLTFTGGDDVPPSGKIEGVWDLAEFYLEAPAMRVGN